MHSLQSKQYKGQPNVIINTRFTRSSQVLSKPPSTLSVLPTSLSRILARPRRRHRNWRHILSVSIRQLRYLAIAGALSLIAYHYLAVSTVYRIVALIVIGIVWSNFASATARKKSVDMQDTIKIQALRVNAHKSASHVGSPALTEDTETYLQAVKVACLEGDNAIQ